MSARYCVPCDKLSDDPVCPHCGRVTDPVTVDEQEEQEAEFEGIQLETEESRLATLCVYEW